jgi:hypothetical protein
MNKRGQLQALAALSSGKEQGTYWIGGWVGLTADTDAAFAGNRIPAVHPPVEMMSINYFHLLLMEWFDSFCININTD